MATMKMLPAPADKCAVCAVDHSPTQPHNQQSLFFQYWFYGHHGRWPTWADAIAHCSESLQKAWRAQLESLSAWSEPMDAMPIACPCDSADRQPVEVPYRVEVVSMSEQTDSDTC